MKVSFRRSGGFAGMFMGCEIDTSAQKDSDSSELESLVKSSGIMTQSSQRVPQARDVFQYSFDIEADGSKHSVTLDQLSVPEPVKPLVEFLMKRSKNMLPD